MNNRYQNLPNYLQEGSVVSATVLTGKDAGQNAFWRLDETMLCCNPQCATFWMQIIEAMKREACTIPGIVSHSDATIYVERLVEEPELVICGGGHISMELATLADYLEYPYVVLDDREEFCNQGRFPNALACLCGDFSEKLSGYHGSRNAYYVIVTRGHLADLECLELILQRAYGYVGMIGSRGKVAKTRAVLMERGYEKTVLDGIHAPIGLDIGGETPKEIAISIVAQLIQEKNRENPSSYLNRAMIQGLSQTTKGMLVTIIGKRGSAPRGTGSKMIVTASGIVCGTIGGGLVEYEAEKRARQMIECGCESIETETYQVNESSAAALGMWCGGEVDVLFEQL